MNQALTARAVFVKIGNQDRVVLDGMVDQRFGRPAGVPRRGGARAQREPAELTI